MVSWSNVNRKDSEALGLDQAVVQAVRQWLFRPLVLNDIPTSFEVRIGFVVRPDGATYTVSVPEPIRRPEAR